MYASLTVIGSALLACRGAAGAGAQSVPAMGGKDGGVICVVVDMRLWALAHFNAIGFCLRRDHDAYSRPPLSILQR